MAIITFAIGLWTVNQHHDVEILSSSSNKTGRKDEEKELHSDSVHGRVRNPTTSDASPLCTAEQMHKITHQLMLTKDKNINNIDTSKLKSFRLSGWFKCPKTSWLDNFYAEETDIVGRFDFLGISVGCNKGHDAIRTARMGLSDVTIDAHKWRREFLSVGGGGGGLFPRKC